MRDPVENAEQMLKRMSRWERLALTTLVKLLPVYADGMWLHKWSTLLQRQLDQGRGLWGLHLSWCGSTFPWKESKMAWAVPGASPIIVSPLYVNFQLKTFKDGDLHLHVPSHKLVPVSGVQCVHPLLVAVLLCILLYSTECRSVAQYLYFKTRMSGSKCKSSSDVASTIVRYCTER